jgi:hypothetical protein
MVVSPPVDRFAAFCEGLLVLDNGKAMRLEGFQRAMLAPLFDGVREAVIVIPKANSKTTTTAAIAFHHLATVPEAEVICVASSRDQATILLDSVRGFIRRNPALARHLTVTQRTVTYPRLGGRLRVISSDVNTSDGTLPTLACVDELHRHRSPELYTLLRDGLGKRGGQMVTISTAGIRGESPLWELRERALALPSARRDGCHVTARSDDGQFVLSEWSLPEDGNADDMVQVELANPASWHTVESLRERHDSPSTVPSEWRRFACNLWVERSEVAQVFDMATWLGLATIAQPIAPVCLAVDAAFEREAAAVGVAGFLDEAGERPVVDVAEFGSGLAWVVESVVRLSERLTTVGCVVDPGGPAASLIPRLQEFGVMVREMSMRQVAMASTGFHDAVREGTLTHRGSEPLNQSVQGAVRRNLAQSWAFDRRKALSDPSPLMAATLALWGLLTYGPISEKAFDERFAEDEVPA